MVILILCILIILLFVMVFMWKQREHYNPSSCIVTMTTYMGFEDRSHNVPKILDSLVATGQEIIVINEWDKDASLYVDFMKRNYSKVKFIQKTQGDSGQARSLNILIRDYLLHSEKKYWIHWEDTWECSRPLLPDLVRIMDKHPQVSQLQVTDDWKQMPPKQTIQMDEITILTPPHSTNHEKDIYEMMDRVTLENWPLFSLRPSINRLSFFQRHANDFYFLEHPHLWPLRFEWEFGRIFLRNKGVKAITKKPYAERIKGHKSTYQYLFTAVPHSGG